MKHLHIIAATSLLMVIASGLESKIPLKKVWPNYTKSFNHDPSRNLTKLE